MSENKHDVAPLALKVLCFAAMVVMAVAILAQGFAGGGLFGSREQARRSSCLNNLKQHGLALSQYMMDYAGEFPWHIGCAVPESAWVDLGLLYPQYNSSFESFICPSSNDKAFVPKCESGKKEDHRFEPLSPTSTKEVISYGYSYDSREETKTAWTECAPRTLRLMADKKAGYEIKADGPNPPSKANHKDDGRNVLYLDCHVAWKGGAKAVDPDAEDDEIGKPDAENYADWWSDPPFYGEGMEEEGEEEAADPAE